MTAVLIVCVIAVGALAIAGWVVNVAQSAPSLNSLKPYAPGSPSQVFAANGTSLGYIWSPSVHTPIAGDTIPEQLKEATIAIEDRRFYQHGALDYQGIVRAAIKDAVKGGNGLQGASTLTMQLVDNTYLPNRYKNKHDLKYKIIQAKLAEQLEGEHSKNWILNSYLNAVPYGTVGGQTAYGVAAASAMFFDKPVQKLSLAQFALLAGLPQAPSEYNPFLHRSDALRRRSEVLQAMATAGYITQDEAAVAATKPLGVKADNTLTVHKDPYVFDFIAQQAARDLCPKTPKNCKTLEQGGLKIYSTIDLRKQALAHQAIVDHASLLAEQGGPGSAAAGLASVNSSNGHIVAIASSADYSQTKFNYATSAHRQPGSSFKTFALMTLIHDYHGDPNDTYYVSKPLSPGWLAADPTWEVHTAEDSYQGTINITKATILSDNTVFVQLAADLGWGKLDDTARDMGITSPLDGNPAEVIGGLRYGVTPLEMADAYATLANGGNHVPATIINKVVFPDGSSRDFGNPKPDPVFPVRRGLRGDQHPQAGRDQRHGHLGQLRMPGGRQDRNGEQPGERVVRGLLAADVDGGLGRLPAGQYPDERRLRRRAGRADLERVHARRLQRLLRQLAAADRALPGHGVLRRVRGDRQARHRAQHPEQPAGHRHDPDRRRRTGHRDLHEFRLRLGHDAGAVLHDDDSSGRRQRRRRRGRQRGRRRQRQRQWRRRSRRPRSEALIALCPVRGW